MQETWLKSKTRRILYIALCIAGFLLLQVGMILHDRAQINTYNGVLMAFQFVLCLCMVRLNYRVGVYISYALFSASLANILVLIFVKHIPVVVPMPGMCNIIIYLITLDVISRQFQVRDREAVTDSLTGLQNRRGLYQMIGERIESEKPFFVVYIDLGNFKLINDNYGHTYGDYLLKLVTERMLQEIGKKGVITRIGGDEFVLLLDGKYPVEDVTRKVLERISEKASLTMEGTKIETYLTACAGIAAYPEDSKDAEALIKYADIAMYQAAKHKGSKICFFDAEMEKYLERQMELERLIKEGLANDYFYLVYQPQYRLEKKRLRGFESLIRMRTPDGTIVSPGEFIPVAEKGDLILQIDDYVLRRAMQEYKDLVKNSDLIVSVNVSAKNIATLGFVDKVREKLYETGFPAGNLEIEITEYCLVQSVETTIDNIERLRELGVKVALDDFGTGYTSLSYLAKMPINLLKVDKSLVDDIVQDEKSRDFVNAVIAMGHLMGCEVISEGVEEEEQLTMLSSQRCDFVQGYVWGKPLAYDDAITLIRSYAKQKG